jgi:hypothetical protein
MNPNDKQTGNFLGIQGALTPTIVFSGVLWLAYLATEPNIAVHFSIVQAALCGWGIVRLWSRNIMAVWSPIFWFLLVSMIYYGLGPLFYLYGENDVIDYVNDYYYVDDVVIARTNMLNTVSIALICAAYEWAIRMFRESKITARHADLEHDSHMLLLIFLIGGYVARGLVVLLRYYSGPEVIIPGALFTLGELAKAGLLIAAYRLASGYPRALPIFVLVAGTELVIALASLMKQQVIEVLLMVVLGLFLAKPSRRLLIFGGPLVVALYIALVPVFSIARGTFWYGGTFSTGEIASSVTLSLFSSGAEEQEGQQGLWFSRLSYPAAQEFAMDAYDRGEAGTSFQSILATVIPRALWPDKPIITQGHEFSYLVKGIEGGGGSGPGFFGEAYWNFGWLGVLIMALATGMIYGVCTVLNLAKIGGGDLRWIPLAYMTLKMGYRPDDWFVSVVIGTLTMLVGVWCVIYGTFYLTSGATRNGISPRSLPPGT